MTQVGGVGDTLWQMCCHVQTCVAMCYHVQTCAAVMAWHGIGQQCIVALRAINLIDVAQIAQMM